MDDEILGEYIADSMENTFGSSDAGDIGDLAEQGLLEEAALAQAFGEDAEGMGEYSEEDLGNAIAEELAAQEFENQMDEEALAEMIAEEIASQLPDMDEDELEEEILSGL